MADGIFYPAASADDGTWVIGGASFDKTGALDFGDWADTEYSTFIRFDNVTIPAGSTITSAFVRLTAYNWTSDVTVNINLYFNDADDATNPTNVATADGKAVTAGINWDSVPAFVNLTTYDTPAIETILQTVVSRGGWSSGNHVLFFLKGENESSTNAYRSAQPIDWSSGNYKAELHVEWTPPLTTSIVDLKAEIQAVRTTSLTDLHSEITAVRSKWWLKSEIKAGDVSITDLSSEIIANAQSITDLLSEIKARDYAFYDLNSEITAVRSKWWLKSSIIAGCSARYSFTSQWNPNRFLMTEIEAKKPHDFSFNTVSGAAYPATSPQIEILTAAGSYPLRTLFLDYLKVGASNEYNFKLWFSRGISGGTTLKHAKIKAEYINTLQSGGFEVVTCDWISIKVNSGLYQTVNETPVNLGNILCDSYLNVTLKVECRDCSVTRGLIFFRLVFTGDLRESIYSDKVVYGDGSQYHAGEFDDFRSIDFIARLYVVNQ